MIGSTQQSYGQTTQTVRGLALSLLSGYPAFTTQIDVITHAKNEQLGFDTADLKEAKALLDELT